MSDNAYINDLEERLAEAEKQLTAANATIAACKAAGFIDAEGRVRKVVAGEHDVSRLYEDDSTPAAAKEAQ